MLERIYIAFIFFFCYAITSAQNNAEIDSLLDLARHTDDTSLKAILYKKLSKEYLNIDPILSQYFSTPEKLNRLPYWVHGNGFPFLTEEPLSYDAYEEIDPDTLFLSDKINYLITKSKEKRNIDRFRSYMIAKEAMTLSEEYNNSISMANAKLNIAGAIRGLNNDTWSQYAYQAIKIFLENNMKDSALIAYKTLTIHSDIGHLFAFSDRPIIIGETSEDKEKIKYICQAACELFESTNDSLLLLKVYDKIADEFFGSGEYRLALEYLKKANNISLNIHKQNWRSPYKEEIPSYVFKNDTNFSARKTLALYLEKFLENNEKEDKINILNKDLKINQLLTEKEKFEKNQKESELKILNQEKEIQVFQISEKDKELIKQRILALEKGKKVDSLNNESNIKNVKLKQETNLKNLFIIGFSILMIMIVVLIKLMKQRQKINKELKEAYDNLKTTQQQLVQSEKMATYGIIASRVAHEILNPLNFVNGFSVLSEDLLKEIIETENEELRRETGKQLLENLQKIHLHGKRADNIVKQLQAHTRAGTAQEFFKKEEI